MRCDETHSTDGRSLGGDDGRSVSTLDIADVGSRCGTPSDSNSPASNPGGAQEEQMLPEKPQRPKSATSLQVEYPDEDAPLSRRTGHFQFNMKICSFAFLVVSLIFIVTIVTVSFSLHKPLSRNNQTSPSTTTASSVG